MASNTNNNEGLAAGLLFLGIATLGIALFILLTVYTAGLSILCLFALFRPLKIGKLEIQPDEARWFLIRGTIGWFLLPFVVLGLAPVFDYGVRGDWIIYIMIAGYILGSLGVECILEKLREDTPVMSAPVQAHSAPIAPTSLPSPPRSEPEPFRYASWDDEEAFRK